MIWIVAVITVLTINIPFGYWREHAKKFSWQWFLAVHSPIPVIILLRILLGLGWIWTTYPIIGGAFFIGQYLGGKWHKSWKRSMKVSGCLLCDILRSRWVIS